MTTMSLLVALNEVKSLLKEANLLKYENTTRPREILDSKFSPEFLSVIYSEDYDCVFKTAMKNSDFDFVLCDDSFLQFSAQKGENGLIEGKIRYAYFPNPRTYHTYVEFLKENEMSYEDVGEVFASEYEQYISEAKLKKFITPIRYDYDYSAYEELNHSVSHLHIGREENIRIPISKMLNPQTFTLFVIKNMYYEYWKQAITNEKFRDIYISAKSKCMVLSEELFTTLENQQMYLH